MQDNQQSEQASKQKKMCRRKKKKSLYQQRRQQYKDEKKIKSIQENPTLLETKYHVKQLIEADAGHIAIISKSSAQIIDSAPPITVSFLSTCTTRNSP